MNTVGFPTLMELVRRTRWIIATSIVMNLYEVEYTETPDWSFDVVDVSFLLPVPYILI